MAKKSAMGQFDEIMDAAAKFVEQQKGVWDHTAWTDFLDNISKTGVEVNAEVKAYLGTLLESMKKYYAAASATDGLTATMKAIAENTVSFLNKTKGSWDHAGWETYLKDMQKKGAELSDETVKYLGSVLEISKELYNLPTFASKAAAKTASKK
ncbi:MAG: hypothetical protein L7F77_15155 [Candidatus Magnetominusculus sp. LBB02]|nr:hypothetical protein [Candidatus Magnetominusculus sp. LBB02]